MKQWQALALYTALIFAGIAYIVVELRPEGAVGL